MLDYTLEEKQALSYYFGTLHRYNSILADPTLSVEKAFVLQNRYIFDELSKRELEEIFNMQELLYDLFAKARTENKESQDLFRGTSAEEIKNIKRTGRINRLLSTSVNKDVAFFTFKAGSKDNPDYADTMFNEDMKTPGYIFIENNAASVKVSEIAKDKEKEADKEGEVLIEPFTNVEVIDSFNTSLGNRDGKIAKIRVTSRDDLIDLTDNELESLKEDIFHTLPFAMRSYKTTIKSIKDVYDVEYNIERCVRNNSDDGYYRELQAKRSILENNIISNSSIYLGWKADVAKYSEGLYNSKIKKMERENPVQERISNHVA